MNFSDILIIVCLSYIAHKTAKVLIKHFIQPYGPFAISIKPNKPEPKVIYSSEFALFPELLAIVFDYLEFDDIAKIRFITSNPAIADQIIRCQHYPTLCVKISEKYQIVDTLFFQEIMQYDALYLVEMLAANQKLNQRDPRLNIIQIWLEAIFKKFGKMPFNVEAYQNLKAFITTLINEPNVSELRVQIEAIALNAAVLCNHSDFCGNFDAMKFLAESIFSAFEVGTSRYSYSHYYFDWMSKSLDVFIENTRFWCAHSSK